MDTILIQRWTAGLDPVRIVDDASVSAAREAARSVGSELGFGSTELGALAVIVSELARNQLVHAGGGTLGTRRIERGGVPGVEIVAADRGAGIAHPTRAVTGEGTSTTGLGVGLAGVLRLADEVDFDVRLGEGSCIWARKFLRPVPRRREVGIFMRQCVGERVTGDAACFVRDESSILVAVADGLGHGVEAREPADRAIETVLAESTRSPREAVEAADAALDRSRGAVMAVVRLDEQRAEITHAAMGNVDVRLYTPSRVRAFAGPAGVLGTRQGKRPLPLEVAPFTSHSVLLLSSDGIRTRVDLAGETELMRKHPIQVAHSIVERFGRDNDDVTVLVVS